MTIFLKSVRLLRDQTPAQLSPPSTERANDIWAQKKSLMDSNKDCIVQMRSVDKGKQENKNLTAREMGPQVKRLRILLFFGTKVRKLSNQSLKPSLDLLTHWRLNWVIHIRHSRHQEH
jgi:hypothetical protein